MTQHQDRFINPRPGAVVLAMLGTGLVVGGVIYAVRQANAAPPSSPPADELDEPDDELPDEYEDDLLEGSGASGPFIQDYDIADDYEPPGDTEAEIGPVELAQAVYAAEAPEIEVALRKWLDFAANAKGIKSGWSARDPLTLRRGGPRRGPDTWSQRETWWVAAKAFNELYGVELGDYAPEIDVGIGAWARNVDATRGGITVRGWLMGMIMARAMKLTGARPAPVASANINPDWSAFG